MGERERRKAAREKASCIKDKKREEENKKHQIQSSGQEQDPAESPSYRLALKSIFNCKSHLDSSSSSDHNSHRKRCKIKTTGTGTGTAACKQQKQQKGLCKPDEEERRASISACTGKEGAIVTITNTKKPLNDHVASSSLFSSSTVSSSCASSNSSTYSVGGSFRGRGMHFTRFSGCYECHTVVDPVHGGSMRLMCTCPQCGDLFVTTESLEHHQAIRHAVSELGPEDTSRNIIEIIFQSSWLKKNSPICTIERILKVQNSQKTISKFEDYRDSIKIKSSKFAKKYPRCIADGNELLRFHCTTLACPLGLNGATNLCSSPNCHVCAIIKDGFKPDSSGRILTMATSGRAHDAVLKSDEKRAMLVCRVIAGRVRRIQVQEGSEEYDSLAGASGPYSNLDELFVLNPRAILPCFVVIYKA